jgi:hypothetical protein
LVLEHEIRRHRGGAFWSEPSHSGRATRDCPATDRPTALFETPQYIFFKYCQALSHLPIYWVFRLNGTSPFILLLNSAAFASIVCACWKGWEIFRRKEAL